jgi:hypothetical protein
MDFNQAITNLSDKKRSELFELAEVLIGGKFTIEYVEPDNRDFSQRFVSHNGSPISSSSTGVRLFVYLIAVTLNERFHTLFIDEPEMGLNPGVQTRLKILLTDTELRRKYYSHVQTFVTATHSHIFIDRKIPSRNLIVMNRELNEQKYLALRLLREQSEMYDTVFSLLGNAMETVFLPSCIIYVEGPSDQVSFRHVLKLHFGSRNISVSYTRIKGGIVESVAQLSRSLGGLSSSPYREYLFCGA